MRLLFWIPQRVALALLAVLLLVLFVPAMALASELPVSGTPQLALSYAQLWTVVIGLVTPLIAYVINSKFWKDAPESVKAFVQALVAAISSAIYVAAATPAFGFNDATLQFIVTTVIAGFTAHATIFRPAHINEKLGARPRLAPPEAPMKSGAGV